MIKKSDRNDFGQTKGWKKLLHKTFMLILWPFKKPLIVIPVLLLIYLVPTFIGAKPSEVHLWYGNKIKNEVKDLGKSLSETTGIEVSLKSDKESNSSEQIVATPENTPQEIRRQMFEKAQKISKTIDVMEQPEIILKKETETTDTSMETPEISTETPEIAETLPMAQSSEEEDEKLVIPADSFGEMTVQAKSLQNLDLIYLNETEIVSGGAEVINANELEINGKRLFLYGIYVDPDSDEGYNTESFLSDLIDGKVVKCLIDAYTNQGIPTGMCYIGTLNINQTLVNEGLSTNVAL